MKIIRCLRSISWILVSGVVVGSCAPAPDREPVLAEPTTTDLGSGSQTPGEVVGLAPPTSQGAPSVIVLEPFESVDMPPPTAPAVMDQFGRDFIPRLLVVRPGQPVLFKNSEDELHTVHVQDDAGESLFNVAMPIRGGEHDHTFDLAGDYAVSCNAHPEMHATILVVESPYAVVADRDGSFTFPNVRPGRYRLVLRRGDERHEQEIDVASGLNELRVDFPFGDA